MFNRAKNLSRTEAILIVVALVAVCISIILQFTYQDLFFSEAVSSADAIAQVISSTSDTRRRPPDSFDFKKIKTDSGLANGDYLYSGENSQITVKFLNGTRILIGEQSLVVLREINGTPDLLIEQGAISGAFENDNEIEIQTKQESVILNGEKDAQFYVTFLKGSGLEIGSIDRNIKVEFNGEKVELNKSKARISRDTGIKMQDDGTGKIGKADNSKAPPPGMPKGVEVADETDKTRITLTPPYPKVDQIFLHTQGGRIPVFPKLLCAGSCEIKLSINGNAAASKKFDRDMVPFFFLTIQPDVEASVTWEFIDGAEVTTGAFEVLKNNEASFQRAFQAKRAVEVIN